MSTFKEYFDTLFRNKKIDPCKATVIIENDKQILYGFVMSVYKDYYDYKVPFIESEICLENIKIRIVTYKKHFYLVYKDNRWQDEQDEK